MPLRTPALLLVACLFAAGCSSSKNDDAANAEGETNPFTTISSDWPTVALSENISDAADGIAFVLKLPPTLKREEKKSDGTFPGYVHWLPPNPFMDPTFTVQANIFPAKNLKEAVERAGIPAEPTKVVGSGELPGGGFYVSILADSGEFLEVEACHSLGEKGALCFSTSVRRSEGIENAKALQAWMESIAKTFALK